MSISLVIPFSFYGEMRRTEEGHKRKMRERRMRRRYAGNAGCL